MSILVFWYGEIAEVIYPSPYNLLYVYVCFDPNIYLSIFLSLYMYVCWCTDTFFKDQRILSRSRVILYVKA